MQNTKSIFFRYRVLWHLAFWIAYCIFYTFQFGSLYQDYWRIFKYFFYLLPVTVLATYFALYILVPNFLLKKRYAAFYFYLFLSAVVFTLAQKSVYFYLLVPREYDANYAAQYIGAGFWNPFYLLMILVSTYNIVIVALFIKIIKVWYLSEKVRKQLSDEKKQLEVKYLRSQLDAHFLFNSLNNLYALARKNASETPAMILKLSKLLSFILYECGESSIPLRREIELINDYIDLERLRYGSRLKVTMNIDESLLNQPVAPLLFFPFVENSFKHGASNNPDEPNISINLARDNEKLVFRVTNNFIDDNLESEQPKVSIGLKNLEARLKILYPDKYELYTESNENIFVAILILKIFDGEL